VAIFANGELILERSVGENNDLVLIELGKVVCEAVFIKRSASGARTSKDGTGEHSPLSFMDVYWCVGIQLSHPGSCNLIAWLADIVGSEEELRGKIGNGDRCWIVECQALDTSKSNVLGDLNTKTLLADNENIGSAHALHRLVTQHIELTTVERLIDLVRGDHRVVYLHSGDQVDLANLLS
jgi:hypothetical protein